jgi:hypothetical protein
VEWINKNLVNTHPNTIVYIFHPNSRNCPRKCEKKRGEKKREKKKEQKNIFKK